MAILSNFLSIIRLFISAQKNGIRGLLLNFIIRIDMYEPCRIHNLAMQFIRQTKSGNIMINWPSRWRVDHMPSGGIKDSGIGKEGPRYAIEELTELRTAILHLDQRSPF